MHILKQKNFTPAALALGSNVGDSSAIFRQAVDMLRENGFVIERIAAEKHTAPVDCPPGTPDFVNSALIGSFGGTAGELLSLTQSIEQALGRPADHGFHTPRTLDIDIIIFGGIVLKTEKLTLPHPAAQERFFVLEPLLEIAPDWVFPDSGMTVLEAYSVLSSPAE